MNSGHVNQALSIPKHIRAEVHVCNVKFSEIRGVSASTEKAPFTCGHQLDKDNLALCGYHHSLSADFALSKADDPKKSFNRLKDYSFNEKDLEGVPSFGERVKSFISKHPLLTLVAAGTAVITGMALYKATGENLPETLGIAKRLVNAKAISKGQSHAVEIRSDTGREAVKICSGAALSEDTIITAASCVTHLNSELHSCKHANGTDATLEDYYEESYDDIELDGNAEYIEPSEDGGITCKSSDTFINLPAKNVTIVFGGNERKYEVDKIVTHSEFNATAPNMHKDIALIKLKNKIPSVQTVQLPTKEINNQLKTEIAANGNGSRPLHPNNLVIEGWAKSNATHVTTGDWQIKQTALNEIEAMKGSHLYKHFNCEKYLCSKSTNDEEQHIHGVDFGAPIIFHGNTTTPYLVGVAAQSSKNHIRMDFVSDNSTELENNSSIPLIFTDPNPATIGVNVYDHKGWIEDNLQKLNAATSTSPADVVLGAAAVVGIGAAMACAAKKALSLRRSGLEFAMLDAVRGDEDAESLV